MIRMSERPCFYSKPKSWHEKGCKKPAKYRVVMSKGFFIDVCEDHIEIYRGMGYKVLELEVAT